MRKTACQEVKKPADRDHVEGMVNKGLGMTCETSRAREEMENICPAYLLRSRIHDHNPLTVPLAFPESFLFMTFFFPCHFLYICVSLPFLLFAYCWPCHITACCNWASGKCLNFSRLNSGDISMGYFMVPYVLLNKTSVHITMNGKFLLSPHQDLARKA